jgi:alginate O-acetyltransferase complex protein AlgI
MVFSSPLFLFAFLPVALLFYYSTPRTYKNMTLLAFSLIFYAWGEIFYIGVMIISIIVNYIFGILISNNHNKGLSGKYYLVFAVCVNLSLLIVFKYANFISDNINILLVWLTIETIDLAPIHLPLGISFFTFQAISYIVDVYRKQAPAQKKIFNLALYISLFPQLIAGPIVRYNHIVKQIIERKHSIELFSEGVIRFIYGLAKKVLIANTLGEVADTIFSLDSNEMSMQMAWIGIVAYTLQIYFDFSGYSDMAIGLGRMFGFSFLENFNFPYVATSLREFWKRWHISLSTWFRDYVYIPLGGNRVPTAKVYINLFIVFFLTVFWHGASWSFIVWGLFHGCFLALEHAGFLKILKKLWLPVQHFYLLFIVMLSWVIFKSDTLTQALDYISYMFNLTEATQYAVEINQIVSNEAFYIFIIAIFIAFPIMKTFKVLYVRKFASKFSIYTMEVMHLLILACLLILSILKISSSTYNPFIYFRF